MQDLSTSVLAGFGSALIVLGAYHFLVARPRLERTRGSGGGGEPAGGAESAARRVALERELAGLTARVAALEKVAKSETPRVGFVRYNAFDDVGSDQSYALALLTKEGDGVVLSSLYSREETRTYGKAVQKFQTSHEASNEERAAIAQAKATAS